MKFKSIKNNSGFTYIEVLIGVAIIIIITATSVSNFSQTKKTGELRAAAHKLASDIRFAQSQTLGLSQYYPGTVKQNGWGIFFKKQNSNDNDRFVYRIFVDKAGAGTDYEYDQAPPPGEIYGQVIKIGGGIEIEDIVIDGSPGEKFAHILFEPPDPVLHIKTSPPAPTTGDKLEIILANKAGEKITVLINKFGLVDIVD